MLSSANRFQPRHFSIVREKHLDENSWTKKKQNPDSPSFDLDGLQSVNLLQINRIIKGGGAICGGQLKYKISDQNGRHLYNGVEDSTSCCVHCCGPARAYSMTIQNKCGKPLLHLLRPLRCDDTCWCCCGCGLKEMNVVEDISTQNIGKVKQKWSMWRERFCVEDRNGVECYFIVGPSMACRCFSNLTFKIQDIKGNEVGEIWKRRKERSDVRINEDHENVGVTYGQEMNTEMKTLLLAATFLLNHTFFEMS